MSFLVLFCVGGTLSTTLRPQTSTEDVDSDFTSSLEPPPTTTLPTSTPSNLTTPTSTSDEDRAHDGTTPDISSTSSENSEVSTNYMEDLETNRKDEEDGGENPPALVKGEDGIEDSMNSLEDESLEIVDEVSNEVNDEDEDETEVDDMEEGSAGTGLVEGSGFLGLVSLLLLLA
jgi:hypothetical protein